MQLVYKTEERMYDQMKLVVERMRDKINYSQYGSFTDVWYLMTDDFSLFFVGYIHSVQVGNGFIFWMLLHIISNKLLQIMRGK